MPRSSNQKLKLMVLADIFRRETNEEHTLTLAQIIEQLSNNGIEAERKSIYSDIEALTNYGMDIVKTGSTRNTSYYLASSDFEIHELKLLADAVALWRKYIHSSDESSLITVIQFVLSCIDRQDRTVNPIAKQIKRHIDDIKDFSFDMEQLSHQLGYTREHLTRSFLSAYHLTPHQYFNQRRMNIALEYLLKGERVGEVAEKLGFSSLYAFSRSFKHHFGLSPQKYLRLPKSQYPLLSSK